ncbi:MAG: SET domain-containing protein-lysine N-methyltransferase [Salinibacterium sp.]|nr:SET domain-containing protein-lysine N-methyltransferase [Salinibacterium sp.]
MAEVEVRSSGIEGKGVFAARAFQPGERVLTISYERVVESADDVPADWADKWHWIDDAPDGRYVLMAEPERYINASCDPTAYTKYTEGRCDVIARRPLERGDEITTDYLICTHDEPGWTCACGSDRCRGENPRSFFDLPDAFQREYEPLLHDWFIAEHRPEYEAMCARLGIAPRA